MTPAELDLVARLCLVRTGRRLDISEPDQILIRLTGLARREGFGTVADLLIALRTRETERLAWPLIECLTVFERDFMEDAEVLDQLGHRILPPLSTARGGAPVRIWCPASGSGQEPYSMAMLAQEAMDRLSDGLQVEIYASDISTRALERARTGLFNHFEVQKGLTARRLVDHFLRREDSWQVSPALREMVRWRRVNPLSETPGGVRFDIILCRGVLPRTAPHMRPNLVLNLAQALSPGGLLILGQGEGEGAEDLAPAMNPLAGMPAIYTRNPAFSLAA